MRTEKFCLLLLLNGAMLFAAAQQNKTSKQTLSRNPAKLYQDSIRNLYSGINLAVRANPANRMLIAANGHRTNTRGTIAARTAVACYFCTANALPVTGLELEGVRTNETNVHLRWKTVSEQNNRGFILERSLGNSTDFIDRGFTIGAGNSFVPLYYEKHDANNFDGISYYRIRQEDMDNRVAYSNTIAVNGFEKEPGISVYPNPGANTTTLFVIFGFTPAEKTTIIITDVLGRTVTKKETYFLTGQNTVALKTLGHLASGLYTITVRSTEKLVTTHFVITE